MRDIVIDKKHKQMRFCEVRFPTTDLYVTEMEV